MDNNSIYFENYKGTPFYHVKKSVHKSEFRINKAREQLQLKPVSKDQIVKYINDFLISIDMAKIECPEWSLSKSLDYYYKKMKEDYKQDDKRDMVWLKFTKSGHVGVVAVSNDINFQIPESKNTYDDEIGKSGWKYNTSGIIVHALDMTWDDTFVLVFPLERIPVGRKRHNIEKAIGNYLIYRGVPILDFYSHNY